MPPKTKTIFQLDSPYCDVAWPQITSADEDTVIQLIVNLLTPIGVHRKSHTTPSKGRRSKKRKAAELKSNHSAAEQPPVPIPEIASYVLIGLNSITRHLSSSAASSCPSPLQPRPSTSVNVVMQDKEDFQGEKSKPQHAALILTTRPPTSPLTTHLPLLCQTASLAYPDLPATRLIVVPAKAEARICEALGVPRAGFVGVLDSAANVPGGVKSLLEFVNNKIKPVVVGEDWLKKAVAGYKETAIKSSQVAVPSVVKKR